MADAVGAGAVRDGEASAPREPGWAMLVSALLVFLLLPVLPIVQVVMPVSQPLLLLIPALAACAVIGWADGGPLWFAVVWVALACTALNILPRADGSYGAVERGWALLLAAVFGLVCLNSARQTRFFARALAALAVSLGVACAIGLAAGVGTHEIRHMVGAHIASLPNDALDGWRQWIASPEYLKMAQADPTTVDIFRASGEDVLRSIPLFGQRYFPALLALESMFAMMLAWWLYHRISRTRIGVPLARLRDFRFDDHLVWGAIVGITCITIPTLADWRGVGFNLTLFFGTLYALRGVGVFAWFLRAARFGTPTLLAIAGVVAMLTLAGGAHMPIAPALLGLIGLGDTWADWRARVRPTA